MTKLTGLFKVDDKLCRISDAKNGGVFCEEWVKGKGFVRTSNEEGSSIAEILWEGMRISEEDAKKLMV